jgi:hypothetical protein
MKAIYVFLLSSLLLVHAEDSNTNKLATIYYVPFDADTYTPLTMGDIMKRAAYNIEVKNTKTRSELSDITSSGSKTANFDDSRVRLLIVYDESKQQIFVDAVGNISDGKAQRALTTRNFDKLKKLLSELTGKVPIKSR